MSALEEGMRRLSPQSQSFAVKTPFALTRRALTDASVDRATTVIRKRFVMTLTSAFRGAPVESMQNVTTCQAPSNASARRAFPESRTNFVKVCFL